MSSVAVARTLIYRVIRSRTAKKRVQTRLQAHHDAYTSVAEDQPADPVDDPPTASTSKLSGRMVGAGGDVKRLNAMMREYFEGWIS